MSEHLEKFIKQNREAFDDQTPGLNVWSEIDRRVNKAEAKRRRLPLRVFVRYAAAVVLLLGIGSVIGYQFHPGAAESLADAEPATEYSEMESYYQQEINQKLAMLASYDGKEGIQPDITQIDETIAELKEELEGVPPGSEERVIAAIIQNYQAKIAILEKILEKTPSNHQTRNKNESVQI